MPDSFGGSDGSGTFMPGGTSKYSGGAVHVGRAARPGRSRQARCQGDHRTRVHLYGHDRTVCHRPEVLMADQRRLQALARPRLSWSHTHDRRGAHRPVDAGPPRNARSEEHTSELQSHSDLVCRLLLEKKKKKKKRIKKDNEQI